MAIVKGAGMVMKAVIEVSVKTFEYKIEDTVPLNVALLTFYI